MKKSVKVEVIEVQEEGLIKLLDEKVTIFCVNYFYTGILKGVNDTCILLENPSIIYDTGEWGRKEYEDIQNMGCKELYIQTSAIEAFGIIK